MKLEKVSAFAEIISSIAILVTLVYLAIQTAQNTAAVQGATRQAMLAEDRELLGWAYESPLVFDVMTREPGSLTDDERIRMMAWLVAFVRNRENQWLQYQNGVIDEATWTTYRSSIGPILSMEITRPWWVARAATDEWDAGFVDVVNEILSGEPVRRLSVPELTDFE